MDRQALGAGGMKRVRGSKRDCIRVMRAGGVKVSKSKRERERER